MKKNTKMNAAKKPMIIAAIGTGVTAIAVGLASAFKRMKKSAKAQHEVDKANFEAAKAEAKANFEENRFHNTFAKAKADAKKSWDDAHMSPSQRAAKDQEARDAQIQAAKARKADAEARIQAAKEN